MNLPAKAIVGIGRSISTSYTGDVLFDPSSQSRAPPYHDTDNGSIVTRTRR